MRQCELLGLCRSSFYYQPPPVSAADLALMRRLDELHLEHPSARNTPQKFAHAVLDGQVNPGLLTAYQEELLSLHELRRRMPERRRREQTPQAELEMLRTQVADQATYLRLAQTLSTFLESLRADISITYGWESGDELCQM
jgi:DNA repair ATPase RecN